MTTKTKISDSIYSVNLPEVRDFSAEFIYNFYEQQERTTISSLNVSAGASRPLDKVPRYISLSWDPLQKTNFEFIKKSESTDEIVSSLISEDSSFSSKFISQNFSDVASIEQASFDLFNFAKLNNQRDKQTIESIHAKREDLLKQISDNWLFNSLEQSSFADVASAYDAIADLPIDLVGLRVYDSENNLVDNQDFFKGLASALSLNVKINKLALPDFFTGSDSAILSSSLSTYKNDYEFAKKFTGNTNFVEVSSFKLRRGSPGSSAADDTANSPPRVKGYLLKRYRKQGDSLNQEMVHYINDPYVLNYNDRDVLYGAEYVYTISVIAEVDILALEGGQINDYDILTINLESRTSSVYLTCFEFTSPPPPTEIKFIYDYIKKNVVVYWDFPVNHQADIKQFQVFRRRTLQEPFELIAQYGFDRSATSLPDNTRFLTGEVVDANNISNMPQELVQLVKDGEYPVYRHVDKDFIVDTEFFETTSYIYALASVDAHGMISNYSTQHFVKFDPYKNKLVSTIVCDEGSPRQYPNLNLKFDTFKDAINTINENLKNLEVHFTPEYYAVEDERGKRFNVVEVQSSQKQDKPYYLMQLINLDNQIVRTIKINISDPENITLNTTQ